MVQQPAKATSAIGLVASAAVTTVDGVFKGYSVCETAAAVSVIEFRDGTVTGQLLAKVSLAASGSETRVLPNIAIAGGVYVKRISGTVDIVVYT